MVGSSLLKGPVHPPGAKLRLHQIFSETAKKEKDNTAILVQDEGGAGVRETTFGAAEAEANRLSRGLLRLSRPAPNPDGDRVCVVCVPPSRELVLVLLAVWRAGAAYLPLLPAPPPQRVSHILAEARPFLVITTKEDAELFRDGCRQVVTVDELQQAAAGLEDTPPEVAQVEGDPIEIILYTSGSTGLAKGVRIRSSSCLNRLRWGWREFPFRPEERLCVFKTAPTFVDSVQELWGSLLAGRPVLVLPKTVTANPQRLVPILHRFKIGRLVLAPTLLKAILTYLEFSNEKSEVLSWLKLWVCSGETLSVNLATDFFCRFWNDSKVLCNFYGSTEIMGDVTFHIMRKQSDVAINGKVPIGNPLDNTIIYLLDNNLETVTAGEIGEIYVGGRHIAAGYVGGRDAFRFIDNPHTVDPDFKNLFKTGDYGCFKKGKLLYEGRTDSQIKIRGHRVDLSEAEAALERTPGVAEGVVLCHNPGEPDQEVLGFVLLERDASIDSLGIEKTLQKSLPNYAVPQIVIVESIPLLESGKVDRQYLLKHYLEESSREIDCSNILGIANGKEDAARCLFKTVYSVLGRSSRSKISATANFYQIGGNSLNSVLTIAKLKEAGYNINISDFISSQSLAKIANKMTLGHEENAYQTENKYEVDIIDEKYKEDVYRIIGDGCLCFYMDPPLNRNAFVDVLDVLWSTLVRQQLSIVVKNLNGDVVGSYLNMDVADEPEIDVNGPISYVVQFLDYLEVPVIETMLPEGKVLHSYMLGTDKTLTPQENVELTEFMECEIEGIGRSRGFVGIFSTNTSPLTQQLAEFTLNYRKLKTYQINQFVALDGTRPFKRGPDTLLAVCVYKEL